MSNSLKIDEVKSFTLLGINIDTHLNWKAHVEKIKIKLSQFVYALSVLKANTNLKTAMIAYYAYAYSWLKYGVVIWGNSVDANDLFIKQKKCLRILANIRQTVSCKPYFIQNKMLTLPCIYILEAAMFIKKHSNLFKFNTNARRQHLLKAPEPKLDIFKKGPHYMLVKIFNKLPVDIRKENKIRVYQAKLKNMLIQKCYYTIEEFLDDKNVTNSQCY